MSSKIPFEIPLIEAPGCKTIIANRLVAIDDINGWARFTLAMPAPTCNSSDGTRMVEQIEGYLLFPIPNVEDAVKFTIRRLGPLWLAHKAPILSSWVNRTGDRPHS